MKLVMNCSKIYRKAGIILAAVILTSLCFGGIAAAQSVSSKAGENDSADTGSVVKTSAVFSEAGSTGVEGKFILKIEPGANWMQKMNWLVFPLKMPPQYACWIETEDGRYVETIAVTAKAGKKKWTGAPTEGRPESLPVWYHASAADSETDVATHATPKAGATELRNIKSSKSGRYVVKFEINHSFDYNDTWQKNLSKTDPHYSGVNGQPSLVYEGLLETGSKATTVQLVPVGTGSVDGSDGTIRPGTEGLTTALSTVSSIRVTWQPGK